MFFQRPVVIIALIIVLALGLRLPGLGSFMTVDEENWMLRSAEFWDHILAGRLDATFMGTHPGSTVMWLVGAGETLQEVRLGFQVHESNLLHFRKSAVLPLVTVASLLIGLVASLLWRLSGAYVGIVAGLLLAADPYVVGSTQIAHLDGLQALFMLASFLSFFVFYQTQALRYVFVSGVLLGLAMGVKLILALWLFPLFALALIGLYWSRLRQQWPDIIRVMGLIIGVAVLTFFVTWPTIWVANDAVRSFRRDIVSVVTDEHVAFSETENAIAPSTFYLRTVLGRVPPHTLLLAGAGAGLAVIFIIQERRARQRRLAEGVAVDEPRGYGDYLVWLVVYALGFLFFITLAAKKADRYALPALVVFPVLVAWVVGPIFLVIRYRTRVSNRILYALLAVMVVAIVTLPLLWSPYAIAYNSPLFPHVRPLSQHGWGEGLDAVAAWLHEQPLGRQLIVSSWYAPVLDTYFEGKVLDLRYRDNYRVKYVILYRNMFGRGPEDFATEVVEELRHTPPVHTVSIHGVPYVWIYERDGIGYDTQHVGELIAGMEVGQTVTPMVDTWDSIRIAFATFSERTNTADVVVHVRESVDATEDLRTVQVDAQQLRDNAWHTFAFEPIENAAGREFYVVVTSPNGREGDAVTVRYAERDILPGHMVRVLAGGREVIEDQDVAYQIPRSR